MATMRGEAALRDERAASAMGGRRARIRAGCARLILSEYFVLWLCVLFVVVMLPAVPELASLEVMRNLLSDMMPLLIVATGEMVVLIIAGIDLSVTSVISAASVFGASIMTGTGGFLGGPLAVPGAIIGMVLLGMAMGALNGASVAYLMMPPFIVTLASMMFFSGAAIWYTTFRSTTTSIADLPRGFTIIGDGTVAHVPVSVLIAAAIVLAVHLAMSQTVTGRQFYAIGKNVRAATVSGVPVRRTIVAAFVISGICAAIASIIYTARLQTGTPILGERILLDVIGAVVIGGTSLFGGKGKVMWTVFGVLFLVLVDTSLKLLGLSLFFVFAIKGGVILLAAVLDALRTQLAQTSA